MTKYSTYEKRSLTFGNRVTCAYWISGIARQTRAQRSVLHNLTLGIQAASTRTRVLALVVYARFTRIAICVRYTFWPTSCVRIAEILRQTYARSGSISLFTNCVSSAWRRITRVYRALGWYGCKKEGNTRLSYFFQFLHSALAGVDCSAYLAPHYIRRTDHPCNHSRKYNAVYGWRLRKSREYHTNPGTDLYTSH